MYAKACLGGGMALLTAAAVNAAEFPLALKTVPADQAWTLPGGSGEYSQLQTRKPSQVKSEPKAVSQHPLYGTFNRGEEQPPVAYRLDESKGTGKGYDTLVLDLNCNNDLTDDTAITTEVKDTNPDRNATQQRNFGPIAASESQCVGTWRPVNFAQLLLYNASQVERGDNNGVFLGYLRWGSGCYLEASVTLDGHTERIAFQDANGNMRLGDRPRHVTARSGNSDYVYFTDGDGVLRDRDGSGKFESDMFGTESEPFADLLYIGAKPYQVSFAKDFTTLKLEPYTGPLGEISLQPKADQVTLATLARETKPKQWELVSPTYVNGKAQVPVGKYRLYHTVVSGKNAQDEWVSAGAYNRTPKGTVTVTAGQSTELACGGPLTLNVTANKQPASGRPGGAMGAALSLFGGSSAKAGGSDLAINMSVNGAGGELYSGYAKGKSNQNRPPQPSFKILTADGKQVASGNLEYG